VTNFDYVKFLNDNFSNDRVNLFFKLLDLLRLSGDYTTDADDLDDLNILIDRIYKIDPVLATSALSDQKLVTKFFESIVDQYAHFSLDHRRLRRFMIDWYASNRSLVSSMRKAIDPYYLTNEELDELIKGYGFPYPGKIISKSTKVGFLYSLIDYQKRKGTPDVFSKALGHFGLLNVIVSEWWLHRNPTSGDFYFKSKPIFPREYRSNSDYILERQFDQIADEFWFQTEADLTSSYANSPISLPSITPFISVHTTLDTERLTPGIAILQRWVDESYQFWVEYVLKYKGTIHGIVNDPDYPSKVSGYSYLIGSTPMGEFSQRSDHYADYASGVWTLSIPTKNDCVFNSVTNTHWVYNGINWINLGLELPTTLLLSNRTGTLKQDIILTNYRHMYSMLEVLLAINYLFNSGNPSTTDNKYVYYDGRYAPFDKGSTQSYSGYSGISGYSGYTNIKDNVIDSSSVFERVQSEWSKVTIRPTTRSMRDTLLSQRQSKFSGSLYLSDSTSDYSAHVIAAQVNSGTFLEAMNGIFKGDIDNLVSFKDNLEVLRLMLLDFERHMMENVKILDVPFTYLILAVPIQDTLKDVVNYFKPYRARLVDMTTNFGIVDPLGHSIVLSDILSYDLSESFTDTNSVTDLLNMQIGETFIDYIHRRGEDPFYYFDLGLKDEIEVLLKETIREIDNLRHVDTYYETFNLVFGDQCPGDQGNFDSSTVSDSITIELIEL